MQMHEVLNRVKDQAIALALMVVLVTTPIFVVNPFEFSYAQNAAANNGNTANNSSMSSPLPTVDPNRIVVLLKDEAMRETSAAAGNLITTSLQEDLANVGIDSEIDSRTRGTIVFEINPINSQALASPMFLIPDAAKMNATERAGNVALQIAQSELKDNPNVEAVGPHITYTLPRPDSAQQSPSIQLEQSQPNSSSVGYQTLPTGIDRSDADLSFVRAGDGKEDVIADVAILDTGVNPHPDLNLVIDKQRAFFPEGQINREIAQTDPRDYCGHGTHVAGIAAAKDNDFGVVGTAPGARIWNFKVLELLPDPNPLGNCSGTNQGIGAALQWVAENADIIDVANLSLGGFCREGDISCDDPIYEAAVRQAVEAGVVIVVAAGNSADDAINYTPARFGPAVTVSAIGDSDGKCGGQGPNTSASKDDSRYMLSNYGQVVDIAAPGVDINSTSNDGGYVVYSGTSMASPAVAGAAASYKAMNSLIDPSPSNVLNTLLASGSTRSSVCDGNGRGYFADDIDAFLEPMLYMAGLNQTDEVIPNQTANITHTATNTTSSENSG